MRTTIDIRLPDGAIKQMPNGSTPLEVAQSISEGLAQIFGYFFSLFFC